VSCVCVCVCVCVCAVWEYTVREKLGRNEASFSLSHKLPVWEKCKPV